MDCNDAKRLVEWGKPYITRQSRAIGPSLAKTKMMTELTDMVGKMTHIGRT